MGGKHQPPDSGQTYRDAELALARGDIKAGANGLQRAADQGSAAAMARLAQFLLHFESGPDFESETAADSGPGPVDPLQRRDHALRLLESSRQAGVALAPYLLAMLAVDDRHCADATLAEWLCEAARLGHPEALRAQAVLLAEHAQAPVRALGRSQLAELARRGDALSAQMHAAYGRTDPPLAGLEPVAADVGPALVQVLADMRAPSAVQALADPPAILLAPELLSAGLCFYLCCFALPRLRPSQVHDPAAGSGQQALLRTSSDAAIDPLEEDFVLRLLQVRMASMAGLPLRHAEHLVVLRYRPGEEYRPHRDTLGPSALAAHRPQAGQRARTVCAYLNPVADGGETDFPQRGVRIAPRPGSAVAFDNLDRDGRPASASLHAGLPVRAGEKWLATLWMRERPYRRF